MNMLLLLYCLVPIKKKYIYQIMIDYFTRYLYIDLVKFSKSITFSLEPPKPPHALSCVLITLFQFMGCKCTFNLILFDILLFPIWLHSLNVFYLVYSVTHNSIILPNNINIHTNHINLHIIYYYTFICTCVYRI